MFGQLTCSLIPRLQGGGERRAWYDCVRIRLIITTWLQQKLHNQQLNSAISSTVKPFCSMALSRVVLWIQASLIGYPSMKINAYLLLFWAVKNIEWGQERSVCYYSTNTAHSFLEKPLFSPCSSAKCLPGLKVKYMDATWKISDSSQNLRKLSAYTRKWYQALLFPLP